MGQTKNDNTNNQGTSGQQAGMPPDQNQKKTGGRADQTNSQD
jgi:hypothetical protein